MDETSEENTRVANQQAPPPACSSPLPPPPVGSSPLPPPPVCSSPLPPPDCSSPLPPPDCSSTLPPPPVCSSPLPPPDCSSPLPPPDCSSTLPPPPVCSSTLPPPPVCSSPLPPPDCSSTLPPPDCSSPLPPPPVCSSPLPPPPACSSPLPPPPTCSSPLPPPPVCSSPLPPPDCSSTLPSPPACSSPLPPPPACSSPLPPPPVCSSPLPPPPARSSPLPPPPVCPDCSSTLPSPPACISPLPPSPACSSPLPPPPVCSSPLPPPPARSSPLPPPPVCPDCSCTLPPPPASSSPLPPPSDCSSPLPPPVCSSTLLPPAGQDHPSQNPQPTSSSSLFPEDLFGPIQTSNTPVPLAGTFLSSSPESQRDVVKQGYLGKLERDHRRYFVLRRGSHSGLSRLEWYKSEEMFTAAEKSSRRAALFGSDIEGLVFLRCCNGLSRVRSSRKGHTVMLYTKDQTIVLVMEDQREQEEWYQAIKKLIEEDRRDDDEHGEGYSAEDGGYSTLTPAAFYKEVWRVTIKPRGLGVCKSLVGENRLCLTASALILIRVGVSSNLPSVSIPLLTVRRFGHLEGLFFMELGRSAPTGAGEIWMETKDRGTSAVAQRIHEVIRETVSELRAEFMRSSISKNNQHYLTLKRRPRHQDRPVNVRPFGSSWVLPPRSPEVQPKSCLKTKKGVKTEPESASRSTPETSGYMEMKIAHPFRANTPNSGVTAGREGREPREEEEEEAVYMMMSPQVSSSSRKRPQGDYMPMWSPQKHNLPAGASLQASCSSFISDGYSPERNPPNWPTSVQPRETESEAGQSQRSISIPRQQISAEQKSAEQDQLPAQSRVTSAPVRYQSRSDTIVPFTVSGQSYSRSVQVQPNPGTEKSVRFAPDQSTGRSRLARCLPCCFRAED
ncbi:insulin receptor substrate 1-like [Xyrichtys novacula]|uniref:Insulin receptor substrate 1-like n=1 Tax=Xyrichtys novacula TaxID=13765 RepID=A0AAV1HRJ3_XYRNO|nr:insulin receptor substrate 1-like [Xyrichtys novacula]